MGPTPQENTALVRRFLSDVLVGGDTDASDAFVAEEAVDHNLAFRSDPDSDGVEDVGRAVLAAADVEVEPHDIVADEDVVAVRATATGTHRESLLDLTPTGGSFEIPVVWFCRVEDGQITEIWSLPDGLGLLRQLGAIGEESLTERTNEQQSHGRDQ